MKKGHLTTPSLAKIFSLMPNKLAYLLITALFFSVQNYAQTPITGLNTNSVPATPFSYTEGGFTYDWGLGTDLFMVSVEIGPDTYLYDSNLTPEKFELKRVDNAITTGFRSRIFVEEAPGVLNYNATFPTASADGSYEEATMLEPIINRGVLDVLHNVDTGTELSNNVERVDVIYNPLTAPAAPLLDEIGFMFLEKGANNEFKVAAITSLNGSGEPASYGPLVTVTSSDYGEPNPLLDFIFFQNDPTPPQGLPESYSGSTEEHGGSLVTFNQLGISANDIVYGISIFGNDVTGLGSQNLLDPSTFPLDTSEGTDFYGAVGAIVKTVNVILVPLAQNDFFTTIENVGIGGDLFANNGSGQDQKGTAPTTVTSFDAASTNGGTVNVNPDGTFTYTPALDFTGSDTFTYTITDANNETSTATVTIIVSPDTDGDGIDDFTDLDDDNDGILDTVENGNCNILQKEEVIELFSEDFGTGLTRSTNNNVTNHTYDNAGAIPDGSYAVVSSLSPGLQFYNRSDINGDLDANIDQFTGPAGGSNNGRYLSINMINTGNTEFYRQSLSSLVIGTDYRYRLDLAGLCQGCGDLPIFRLEIQDGSGTILQSVSSAGLGVLNDDIWKRVVLNFTATTTSVDIVIFNDQPSGAAGNDVGVDNIVFGLLQCPASLIDQDGDGIINSLDLDSDNDGIPDVIEAGGTDPDGDGIIGAGPITDIDGDGLEDSIDNIDSGSGVGEVTTGTPLPVPNTDGDSVPNYLDLDSDNDGITDVTEAGGTDANGDGIIDGFTDLDDNGLDDATETTPLPVPNTDGDSVANYLDLDSDNDGITDTTEAGGTDADGDGIIDGFADADGNGLDDATETTPLPVPNTDGDTVPNYLDLDSDNDGITDVTEAGGTDANGDGIIDGFADGDGNGLDDTTETTPLPVPNSDGDTLPNYLDLDSDNDGITDTTEAGGTDANGDGLIDGFADGDNNGLDDTTETTPLPVEDKDSDGTANYLDLDSDNDGITDTTEAGGTDANSDGIVDGFADGDGDGLDDATATTPLPIDDFDNDGLANYLDLDSDADGISDIIEAGGIDADGDAHVDYGTSGDPSTINDGNNNGLDDTLEGTPLPIPNTDSTFGPDYLDIDADGDGIVDNIEGQTTASYSPPAGTDSDNDGLNDEYDGDDNNVVGIGGATGIAIVPTNTDGAADNPDYLDTDSDDDGDLDILEAWDTDNDGTANTVPLNADADGDGLDNAFDNDNASPDPTNVGTVPTDFPDLDTPGGDRDWREALDIDWDNDGIDDAADLDSDNDGIPDTVESGGNDPYGDEDGDGIENWMDTTDDGNAGDGSTTDYSDLDGNGIPDVYDTDGDGVPNQLDLDSDNDGIYDIVESGQIDAANNVVDINNDGIIDAANSGTVGANGLFDPIETDDTAAATVTNPTADSDGDGTPDSNELDADNDGCNDVLEAGFTDGDNNGTLGNGTFGAGLTVNANGVVTSGVDGYTVPADLDSNTVYDFQQPSLSVPAINSDPVSQTIIINSNVTFSTDILATISYQWQESTDGGATWNSISNGGASPAYSNATTDALTLSGVPASYDGYQYRVILSSPAFVCDSNWTSAPATLNLFSDYDGDGIPDITDLDDDNDGIPDAIEGAGDTDGDGIPNRLDLDSDNDGIYDIVESGQIDALNNVVDLNNDGIIDAANAGTVGANGLFDPIETDDTAAATVTNPTADSDGDGTPDSNELDADNDGCNDVLEAGFTDGDVNGLLGNGTFGAGLTVSANGVVTSGVDGYTVPDDLDTNTVYDFQQASLSVPLVNTDPVSQTITINSNVTFSTDILATISYQWQESTDGITWNDISNGGANAAYSGATTDALTLTGVPLSYNGYQYRVILSSPAFVCDSNWTSAPATLNLFPDNDGDGIPDITDLDDDNDGIPDAIEGAGDTDGDGILDQFDLDSDNDGIYDVVESGQLNGTTVVDANNDGVLDGNPADFGANGLLDLIETDDTAAATVTNPTADSDGDGTPDSLELDADNDGCNDVTEAGLVDNDSNGRLGSDTGLTVDANGLVNTPGTTGYTTPNDLDNNGIFDFQEVGLAVQPIATQPLDQVIVVNANVDFSVDMQNTITYQWQMSTDGGANWTNVSNGGTAITNPPVITGATTDQLTLTMVPLEYNGYWYRVVLSSPAFACDTDVISDPALLTVYPDFDGDGVGDPIDLDDDNDGIPDLMEHEGLDPLADNDGDGVPAYLDDNDNNISVGDANDDVESAYDFDGDGFANHLDLDADGDGILDVVEAGLSDLDTDNDGVIDGVPADFGVNGLFDPIETDDTLLADINYVPWNSDGDTQLNFLDIDDDADGILTSIETDSDSDGDGHPDYLDQDADNDGIPDNVEAQTTADYNNPSGVDANGDGLDDAYGTGLTPVNTDGADNPDYLDSDSDNDNVPDSIEGHDFDADGIADVLPSGTDSDNDGLDDAYDGSVGDFADPNGLAVGTDPASDLPNRDNDLASVSNNSTLVTGDNEVDYRDTDDDGDGIPTIDEDGDKDGDPTNDNCDEDPYPDYLDPTACDLIPDGFSPNGDGLNDILVIPALAQYKNFDMEVYDRWGNLVYEYSRNGDAQPDWWDGYSSGTMTIGKGNKVPVGTYYFVIKFNEAGMKPIAEWVYINY